VFVRKKPNNSGTVSVQVIDKSRERFKVIKTIGSSADERELELMVAEAKRHIQKLTGVQEIDFYDYQSMYAQVLSSITAHKLVGIEYVLGKLFDAIGFNVIKDPLFKELVLYRLVFPASKLKTTEFLYRYEQKSYSEDDIYSYMDKLHSSQKELIQRISYAHTLSIIQGGIQAVFYDVTTLYFEIEQEDDLRKTGFSKDGKSQHAQIVLGLLVSHGGYPLAYDIYEGNKYEGDTIIPILDGFKEKYAIEKLTVISDAGLLSKSNVNQLMSKGYHFILGARIKNEQKAIKDQILKFKLRNGEHAVIEKEESKLIVTYANQRAKKDENNRARGIKKLEKQIASGKLTKASINNRGYNKFLALDGQITVSIDYEKAKKDAEWDGLKGYLTNSPMNTEEILNNYKQLWQIEKAFKVAKSELKIRPIYHRKQKRIEAHICINFTAYKIYKELERFLKQNNVALSPEKVIEIIQNIYEISLITPNNQIIRKTLVITEEQKLIQQLFKF